MGGYSGPAGGPLADARLDPDALILAAVRARTVFQTPKLED